MALADVTDAAEVEPMSLPIESGGSVNPSSLATFAEVLEFANSVAARGKLRMTSEVVLDF